MTDFAAADAALLDRTDARLARPLPSVLAEARRDALAAATAILAIPEADLARPWDWIGGSQEEVRYGAYRAAEALELAEIEARAMLAPVERDERLAARLIAPATAARWDLHGLLLPLGDDRIDADPGGGEWTIRLVLGHVIASQRGYGVGTAWWNEHPHAADDPALPRIPEDVFDALPDEATTEAEGSLTELRARLDHVLDLATERLAGLSEDRLALAARWSGFAVTIEFRLGRWGSHLREHSIQVEKTLAMLRVVPGEPARLARHVLAGYGRVEATIFGRASSAHLDQAAQRVADAAAEGLAAVESAAAAARISR
jgi:hypothetical protein